MEPLNKKVDDLTKRVSDLEKVLSHLIKSDRYIFHKTVQLLDGRNLQLGLTTGTKIATAPAQKLAFWGGVPTIQFNSTGETVGVTGTNFATATFSGNIDGNAYTISDIVKALKFAGIMA